MKICLRLPVLVVLVLEIVAETAVVDAFDC